MNNICLVEKEGLMLEKSRRIANNLVLIGSLLPYRGGVAQHTTMLHRTLIERTKLLTVSFKRQYPNWLYPGKSNFEPDYNKDYREQGVYYVLDSLNPFSWIRVGNLIKNNNSKLVIIPWWTIFWTPCFVFIAQYLKKNGIKILFLCHNILSHENAFWKLKLTKQVLLRGDYFLVDNTKNAEILSLLLPDANISIHPMPSFHNFPPAKKLLPRRSKLELLFFGFVRSYKGVDLLLEAMHFLKDRDIFLTIAGEWWINDKKSKEFIEKKQLSPKIEIANRYLKAKEVSEYFSRADVIILPYKDASGTGVIPLAYHYGKPVIATNVGGLPELVEDKISGLLIPPNDSIALAGAIEKFFDLDLHFMKEAAKRKAKHMNFQGLADCILSISS
jgi:glycosyltransferase involved in cell wall biosynthesis